MTEPRSLEDEREFRRFVEQHGPRLFSVARGVLGDANAAECVVQDTFVRFARGGHQVRDSSGVDGWLYRVCVNLCRDELRRRRRATRMVPLELVKNTLHAPDSAMPNIDSGTGGDDALWRRLDQLPRKLRDVVLLRFVGDMSYAQLAELLGVSTGTVSSRLYRALRRLGSELRHLQDQTR
jgi:RNA polymerase sigma-70 factor, ECF subfamily